MLLWWEGTIFCLKPIEVFSMGLAIDIRSKAVMGQPATLRC